MRVIQIPTYIVLILLIFSACGKCKKTNDMAVNTKFKWQTYRGVNVNCEITEEDIKFLAGAGGNLVRLSMPICTFIEMEEPYGYDEMAFEKLDSVLDWGEKYDVDVLIDPHKYPGTEHEWTMLGNDPFFQDFKWHDIVIKFWERIAEVGAKRGKVIAGYDLLNEPQVDLDMKEDTPADVNLLYKKLTETIRKVDSVHTIVYALPRVYDRESETLYGYHKGIMMFEIPKDDNICLETHTYMPQEFSHQNIWEVGEYITYPVTIKEITWNKQQLIYEQEELIDFSKKNPEVPILVGEFSSPRWTGEDGIRYLTDVIEIAEDNGWSWAYHAYRENQVWDPEMSIQERSDSVRIKNAPRWKLLQYYFKRNEND